MGSFRSEPELTKHTQTGSFEKINFAVSHMCGILWINIKDGEFTCKMHILVLLLSVIRS